MGNGNGGEPSGGDVFSTCMATMVEQARKDFGPDFRGVEVIFHTAHGDYVIQSTVHGTEWSGELKGE